MTAQYQAWWSLLLLTTLALLPGCGPPPPRQAGRQANVSAPMKPTLADAEAGWDRYLFNLFADHHQFFVMDERSAGIDGESWKEESYKRLLALETGALGVGTLRNATVPVVVEVWKTPPPLKLEDWDQVVECGLEAYSGRIVVMGCTDDFVTAPCIGVTGGRYRVRVLYGGLTTISQDGQKGQDRYHIQLWPGEDGTVKVLKERSKAKNGGL